MSGMSFSRLSFFLFLLSSMTLSAQDLTTPMLTHTWQSTFSNPALYGQQPGQITIGLPGVSNDLAAENITYNELLYTENGRRILDLNSLPDLLSERNGIRNDFTLETIGASLRGDRLSAGVYHRLRAFGEADYPKTLVQVIAQGNAQFIGQSVEIAPLGFATSYHEIALGASYAITDNIHFGARIKYLSGIADLRTTLDGSLQLSTGEENFALTLDQDLTINTAGTIDYNGLDDINVNYDLNRIETDDLFSDNNGLAFDLGLFADFGPLHLQAAANDLGARIDWSNDVSNLRLEGIDEFSGLDILEQLLQDSVSFAGAIDSLRAQFEPAEDNNAYRSDLPSTYLIGGEYDVTERLTAGVLLVHYNRTINSETAFAINARYEVIEQLTVGLNFNSRRGAAANLGMHLLANIGPVNLLATTDNLLTVFRQKDSSRAAVRLGAALSFGAPKAKKKVEGKE